MFLLSLPKKIVNFLENYKAPLRLYFVIFIFFCLFRNVIEMFADGTFVSNELAHYGLFYVCLAMTLWLVFYWGIKETVVKTTKIVISGFALVLLAPILDLIISKGVGYNIDYLTPSLDERLYYRFLTYFGKVVPYGITIGMRIEMLIVLLFCLIYFLVKTKRLIKSIGLFILVYSVFFAYMAFPYFLSPFIRIFGRNDIFDYIMETGTVVFISAYLLLAIILVNMIFLSINKNYFISFWRDVRWLRLLHFIFCFVAGIVVLLKYTPITLQEIWNLNYFFKFFLATISIMLAWIFSIMVNNQEDLEIDKISNQDRPTVKEEIPIDIYRKLSYFVLFLSIIYALAVGFPFLFFILLFILFYYTYSAPPLRAKKWTIVSKFFVAINSLVLIMAGFCFFQPDIIDLSYFPVRYYLYFILFGFCANLIDIKDYEGDKVAGIKTMPVIMGLVTSKRFVGFCFIITYLSTYFIFSLPSYSLLILAPLGIIQYFLINRKKYSEKPVLMIYLLTMIWVIYLIY